MMTTRISAMALAALLSLAACQSAPENDRADSGANAVTIEERQAAPTDVRPDEVENPDLTEPEGSMAGEIPGGVIPAPFQGRWALSAADCGADKGAAKGLLTIGSQILRFYESVAEPLTLDRASSDSLSGSFAFSGEGMEWTKDMTLTLGADSETLVRTETKPAGSYTYTRCPV